MALTKQFSRKLDHLWKRRTVELRRLVVTPGRGQTLKFTRRVRDALIDDVLGVATSVILKREGNREFQHVIYGRRLHQLRGRVLGRGEKLLAWAREEFNGPIVYAFWQQRKCLYVGKGISWRRLRDYRKSLYIREATCIEVFQINGKSHLGKAECLATHLFNPRDNINKASEVRWGKSCPICEKHDRIRTELTSIFKMK